MKLVKHILKEKGNEVITVQPDSTVYDALIIMAEEGIGALVVKQDGQVCGVFSERDYARKVVILGKASKIIFVKDIMTTNVLYVNPDETVEYCMRIMTEKRLRHLPVLEKDRLYGIISIGDIVKALMDEDEFYNRPGSIGRHL